MSLNYLKYVSRGRFLFEREQQNCRTPMEKSLLSTESVVERVCGVTAMIQKNF